MDQIRKVAFLRWLRVAILIGGAGCVCLNASPAMCANDPGSCSASPESRRLDYWLGEWTVTFPGATGSATSKVYLELERCLLVESWDGRKGHNGENLFAYSSDDKHWHAMFADN